MGIDFLDLAFRLQKSFGIGIPNTFIEEIADLDRRDVQARQVHLGVIKVLIQTGTLIPWSSWHRVKVCIAQTGSVKLARVNPDSWLIMELGFC